MPWAAPHWTAVARSLPFISAAATPDMKESPPPVRSAISMFSRTAREVGLVLGHVVEHRAPADAVRGERGAQLGADELQVRVVLRHLAQHLRVGLQPHLEGVALGDLAALVAERVEEVALVADQEVDVRRRSCG